MFMFRDTPNHNVYPIEMFEKLIEIKAINLEDGCGFYGDKKDMNTAYLVLRDAFPRPLDKHKLTHVHWFTTYL